jgi:hypothetical protein
MQSEPSWGLRPCKHCGGGHLDSTCSRRPLKFQQGGHSQRKRHAFRIDEDGDIVIDEWTNCVYCVLELGSS